MTVANRDEVGPNGFRTHPASLRCALVGAVLAIAIVASGCATGAKISASNEIATAQFAIRDARANDAETHAPEALGRAEALLAAAEKESGADAERMAEKAVAYAQLAESVARRTVARKQLRDARYMEQEAEALKVRTTNAVEDQVQ